jgi:MOSC domain-containing protein YiiM
LSLWSLEAQVGKVLSVNISESTGEPKSEVGRSKAVAGFGLEGDAHGGDWHRQVSLLAEESIDKMRAKGLKVSPGAFGENVTTRGIELATLPVGTRLKVGDDVVLEVTQVGKECTEPCAIFFRVGDCVMPREGIFARVLDGGEVARGDEIVLLGDEV